MTTKFTRWIPILAGVFIQLCLGTAYIWGVFQTVLTNPNTFGWKETDATLTFSLLLATLTFGSMAGGIVAQKASVRTAITIGGIIMGLGFILASFSSADTPYIMWAGYGLMGGFGMGMAYTNVISVSQRWFPDKRGLITGLIVAALGLSGVVFTPLAEWLVDAVGVMMTFAVLGIIFVFTCLIGSFFVKNPPEGYVPEGWTPPEKSENKRIDFTPKQVLKTPQFYMIVVAFMLASSAGFMVIPFAKYLGIRMLAEDKVSMAKWGVSIIAIFNALGRILWGFVSDKFGRKNTLIILMLAAGVSVLFVPMADGFILVMIMLALVGIMYGGFLGVFPALSADYFGIKNAGINYGMVMFGFSAGAVVFSNIAGHYKALDSILISSTTHLTTAFYISAAVSFVGAVIIYLLKPPKAPQ